MTTVKLTGHGGLDTTDFKSFSRALRRAQPVLAKGLRVQLRAAGELVAEEARGQVSGASKSIPPTIKVRTSGVTVSVIAGGNGKPLAGLFELGNASGGGGGTFRHPVYGNQDVWVNQPMHPFLGKALDAKKDEAMVLVVNALDDAIREAIT